MPKTVVSTFFMVELVGHSFFQCLEYGTGLSYVVNLERTNARTFEDTERAVDALISLILFAFPFDLFVSVFLH